MPGIQERLNNDFYVYKNEKLYIPEESSTLGACLGLLLMLQLL